MANFGLSVFDETTKSRNEMTKRNDEIKQRNHPKTARFTASNFDVPVYIRGTFRYILCSNLCSVRTFAEVELASKSADKKD